MLGSLFRYIAGLFGKRPPVEVPRAEAVMMLRLLQNNRVQTELSLNADQVRRIRDAIQGARQKHRSKMEELRAQGEQAMAREMPELQAIVAGEVASTLSRYPVLNTTQQTRFRQIMLQNRGPAVFGDPEIQSTLAITPEQKTSLRSIVEGGRRKARQMMQEGEVDAATARREVMVQVLAVLTEEQRRRWQEMTGPLLEAGPAVGPVDSDDD